MPPFLWLKGEPKGNRNPCWESPEQKTPTGMCLFWDPLPFGCLKRSPKETNSPHRLGSNPRPPQWPNPFFSHSPKGTKTLDWPGQIATLFADVSEKPTRKSLPAARFFEGNIPAISHPNAVRRAPRAPRAPRARAFALAALPAWAASSARTFWRQRCHRSMGWSSSSSGTLCSPRVFVGQTQKGT